MRAFWCACLALALGGVPGAQDAPSNRLWWAEFELRGPLEALSVDCGQDGELRLEAQWLAGEERRLLLPLPVYSPLGAAGLDQIPLDIHWDGDGMARFVAWSEPQPNHRFRDLAPGLRSRSRPPARRGVAQLSGGVMALFLASMLLVWAARRRVLILLPLSFASAFGLAWLASGQRAGAQEVSVLELDLDSRSGFEARASWARMALPDQRLEVQPPHAALEFELRLESGKVVGSVEAGEHSLVDQARAEVLEYTHESNPGADLEQVWVRLSSGDWSFHGPWKRGQALGSALIEDDLPPSWLLAGLPPGRGALFGRFRGAEEHWIRALGFNPR